MEIFMVCQAPPARGGLSFIYRRSANPRRTVIPLGLETRRPLPPDRVRSDGSTAWFTLRHQRAFLAFMIHPTKDAAR
ncbi:MAG: hypothetical protein WA854_06490, partial [Candidatus Binataceae bacterium]